MITYGQEFPDPLEADPATGGVTVALADVEPERVDWLWYGRLPLGKIVVLDGDPSVGKSTTAVDCAARVSSGRAWPDGAPNRSGAVLLLSAEDGLADTIRPRLDAAGGDPRRVHALTEIRYLDEEGRPKTRPVTLADLEHIEAAVRRVRALLVVVDVMMAFLPSKVDSHRDQDVRGVLSGLAAMAERTGSCVLLLRHLNKASGGSAMYRGGGSIGIIGAARVGLLAAHDPEDDTRRVLAGIKSNLAPLPDALAYQLVDSPEHGCARVEWLGVSQHSAGALLAGPRDEDERTTRDEAAEFIRCYLTDCGGEAPARDVLKAGHAAGFNERTLQDTRKRTSGLTTARRGFGKGAVWVWAIDARIDPIDASPQNPAPMASMAAPMPSDTPSATVDLAPCGHPLTAINTANGRCALCIVEAAS
ncbi:MAG TPA: AAA family ATPase [Jatrophihabitans sp.]|nr:AAA family ATPase [Jatrophihabitans sp.]